MIGAGQGPPLSDRGIRSPMMAFLRDHWLEVASIMVALAAISVAVWRITASRRDDRERSARSTWREYNIQALTYPLLAYPDLDRIKQDLEEYERYEWFVAFLIETCAEILATMKQSPLGVRWEDVLRRHLSFHWRYLESDDFRGRVNVLISGRLKRIIEEAKSFGRDYHHQKYAHQPTDE